MLTWEVTRRRRWWDNRGKIWDYGITPWCLKLGLQKSVLKLGLRDCGYEIGPDYGITGPPYGWRIPPSPTKTPLWMKDPPMDEEFWNLSCSQSFQSWQDIIMWFLTSSHLWTNLWSKFHLGPLQKVYKPCLILSGLMWRKLENRLMSKSKACENVQSSLESLSTV